MKLGLDERNIPNFCKTLRYPPRGKVGPGIVKKIGQVLPTKGHPPSQTCWPQRDAPVAAPAMSAERENVLRLVRQALGSNVVLLHSVTEGSTGCCLPTFSNRYYPP